MRVLVTGGAGMLSTDIVAALQARSHDVVALPRTELDVTDHDRLQARIEKERPGAVVFGSAFSGVDLAEREEGPATAINAEAAGVAARACEAAGALFVYPSTDYVFSGESDRPYLPSDDTGPINAYGRSKLAGERASLLYTKSLVVRTSWLFGAHGPNFVATMLRLAAERETIEVVDDQIGRPTWCIDLANSIVDFVERGATGIVHVTGAGDPVSWAGFATEIFSIIGSRTRVVPVPSSAIRRSAQRPGYSVLNCAETERLLGRRLRPWREGLLAHLENVGACAAAADNEQYRARPRNG